jgi:hypothetical protein
MRTDKISGLFLSGLCLILVAMLAPLTRAQQETPAAPPAPAGAPVTQWPQRVDSPDGLITVYQPQPAQFEGDTLTARAAVSLTPPGATEPQFGALFFTARVATDRDTRIVTIQDITIKDVKLPNSTPQQEQQFGQVLQQRVPSMNLMLSLDQLESTLALVQKAREESQQLDNTPPKIVFTPVPTTLVLLDGPPKLQASADPGVMTVVNTPFILLFELSSKRYFLKAGDTWMVAPDVMGPWTPAGPGVPSAVVDAGSKLTPQNTPPSAAQQPPTPTQILVAEEPTELISSDGPPAYTPIPGNDLLYMSSTQSDVFLEVSTQNYFVLLSGRWFESKSLQGPWAFVASDKLPAAFAQIPADSPKANVLASVAATQQAKDARMDAYVPQTTAIRRDAGASLQVTYDGNPQFTPVQNTPVTYATNSAESVFEVGNVYYCCAQAVWYTSPSPLGPWAVCTSVPQVIYTIPPSCPLYNCRYCYVYDSTPDVVYCGYLPGYTGCYVYGPTVVYGTGYTYPYWYQNEFIAYPYTWGFGAQYDFYAGTWGYGAGYYYGPDWFAHRAHDRWFGAQGYVDYRGMRSRFGGDREAAVRGGNVTNIRNVSVNRINIYDRQENAQRNVVRHSADRAEVAPRDLGGNQARVEGQAGGRAQIRALPKAENNVLVGQDGTVYRRTASGWEQRAGDSWKPYQEQNAGNARAAQQGQAAREGQQNAAHTTPERASPAQETPAREAPARETPAREAPAQQTPSHFAQPSGLEAEYAARQRGSAPSNSGESHAGGGAGSSGGGGGASSGGGGGHAGGGGGGGGGGRR